MLDAEMRESLEVALRSHDLRGLVDRLRRDGRTQVAIYDLFAAFYSELGEAGREADEDEVGRALDHIWGWCRPGAEWFDEPLTDDAVRAYREASRGPGKRAEPAAAPDRPAPGD